MEIPHFHLLSAWFAVIVSPSCWFRGDAVANLAWCLITLGTMAIPKLLKCLLLKCLASYSGSRLLTINDCDTVTQCMLWVVSIMLGTPWLCRNPSLR